MIAITGANGNLGKATIQFLLQKVAPTNIVAIVRNPEKVNDFKEQGVIIRQADYNDYDTLKQAFKGIEKVLQISTSGVDMETAKQQEKNVVNAMAENNVKHIVYTSMIQARPNTIFQGTEMQYHTEELIKNTKTPYTFFRNSMYMEAIPELIGNALQTNEIRYPSGRGKVSFVSRNDIAEAIANVLTEATHENKTYEITGNQAFTFNELAKLINTDMKHIDISDNAFRKELLSYQLPVEVTDLLVSMANGIKAGEFAHLDNTLEKLLGKKLLSLSRYVKQNINKQKSMKKEFKPTGYNSASPYFIVNGAQKLIDLLKEIFNAKELRRYDMPDGTIMHAEIQIDDSVIMLGDASEKFPPVHLVMHVYVPDVDETFAKAIESGCEIIEKPKEREVDPDRRATFKDFAGNIWSVGTQLPTQQ